MGCFEKKNKIAFELVCLFALVSALGLITRRMKKARILGMRLNVHFLDSFLSVVRTRTVDDHFHKKNTMDENQICSVFAPPPSSLHRH